MGTVPVVYDQLWCVLCTLIIRGYAPPVPHMRDLSAQLGEGEGILILDEEGPHGEGLQFKRTEEMAFLLGFPANLIYLAAECSEEDDDVVLLGQMLQ